MSVLVYIESKDNIYKKSALEALSYGRALADKMGTNVTGLIFNCSDTDTLKKYGAQKIIVINSTELNDFSCKKYSNSISKVISKEKSSIIVLSSSPDSKYLAAYLSGITDSACVSNVIGLPESFSPFIVKRSCFTNKAFSMSKIESNVKILNISSNSFGLAESLFDSKLEALEIENTETNQKILKIENESGNISIADADIVVSAGRGLKGPENWQMIENLADILGAATACSKPVSDMGWRPHSEHVGQTGKPVSSNLYIAIGISGAIQHLAGINSSKVKVVINNDPEAPFFKAADYGVIGDAFDIVPRLIDKLKSR